MKNLAIALLAGALLASAGFWVSSPAPEVKVVERTVVEKPAGALAGPDVFSRLNVQGHFTQGCGNTATTSTAASYTLLRAELADACMITWLPNVNTTLTFPATSTITDLVPNVGDSRTFRLYNASTTAASSITLAAGTGIDLQFSEGTGGDLVLNGLDWGVLTFVRQADTDVTVIWDEFTEAD